MRRVLRFAAALTLAWVPPAHALLGVGDLVYDPAATAQAINLLRQAQQEFDRLGSLLGVSTRQYDQLLALAGAIGNGRESAPYAQALTPSQVQAAVRAVPGLAEADLAALLNPSGLLDVFLGLTPAGWQQAVETPTGYLRALLVGPALARAGSADPGAPASTYAQWYSGRSAEDQQNLGGQGAVDLASVLAGDWLDGARKRRMNLEGLAAENQAAGTQAAQAQTLADLAHGQTRLGTAANAILLESAVQATEAGEAAVRALEAQNQLVEEAEAHRRDAEELQLDAG
jgi:hypothetical protein